ncbi:MAG: hypothetical protein BM560_00960 [Roseobacter sp. MedPE-SWde]|nr:MAG: hypothetical protein BM560_00960 [Roseobacter sp. MedPE-SWde]
MIFQAEPLKACRFEELQGASPSQYPHQPEFSRLQTLFHGSHEANCALVVALACGHTAIQLVGWVVEKY